MICFIFILIIFLAHHVLGMGAGPSWRRPLLMIRWSFGKNCVLIRRDVSKHWATHLFIYYFPFASIPHPFTVDFREFSHGQSPPTTQLPIREDGVYRMLPLWHVRPASRVFTVQCFRSDSEESAIHLLLYAGARRCPWWATVALTYTGEEVDHRYNSWDRIGIRTHNHGQHISVAPLNIILLTQTPLLLLDHYKIQYDCTCMNNGANI